MKKNSHSPANTTLPVGYYLNIKEKIKSPQLPKVAAKGILHCLLLLLALNLSAQLPSGFVSKTVQEGYSGPMGVVFTATGNLMFSWDRAGHVYVSVWNGSGYTRQTQPVLNISDEVGLWADHGLMSVCLDPQIEQNGLIYLYYIVDRHHLLHAGTPQYDSAANEYNNATIGRVTRYQLVQQGPLVTTDYSTRKILLGESISTGIVVTYQSHTGGSLIFGRDNTLLLSTGDGGSFAATDSGSLSTTYFQQALADGMIRPEENVGAFRAQMINSHSGKVLRFDANTGDGIPSNPFFDAAHPRSPQSRVWAMGCRNPFRMALQPNTGSTNPADGNPGTLLIGDVGYKIWEEVDIVQTAGLNLGWPLYEGQLANADYYPLNKINPDEGQLFKNLCLQPTSFAIDPVVGNRRYTHYRPAAAWKHGVADVRVPWFNGTVPTDPLVGAAGSPVAGDLFTGRCAIGGTYYTGTAFGAIYQNTYFFGDFSAKWINVSKLSAQPPFLSIVAKFSNPGAIEGLVDIKQCPMDNSLYYTNIASGKIVKIYHTTTNQSPVVSITSPVPPAIFSNGSTIPITVAANDADGRITKVELLYNDAKFGEDTAAPYTFTGSNVPAGVYKLVARATDDSNTVSISDTLTITVSPCSGSGTISGEGYFNIPGTQVADLTANLAYPDSPSVTGQATALEYYSLGDNYGGRMRGYICAPLTGDYTFFVAADDQGGVFLSTNDDPANKVLIAYVANPVPFHAWEGYASQHSVPIRLVQGTRYYIETLHKQSTGANHMGVAWIMPNGVGEFPIPGSRLSPYTVAPFAANPSVPDFTEAMRNAIHSPALPGALSVAAQPNPSISNFTLHIKSNSKEAVTLRLTDIQGRVVETIENAPASGNIQLGKKLAPGVYFVEVRQGIQQKILKLVKQ